LAVTKPEGLHYSAFCLDDGVSFVHLAVLDGEDNPLLSSAAFGRFQADLGARCVVGPAAAVANLVGNYSLLPD